METFQPKLRFPEFDGNWITKHLGSFADVSKLAGYEFTKHIQYEETGKIIALRGLNIKNNSLDLTEVKYIDNSELNKLSRSKLYINDIMFTYIGTIGEVALIKENDKFYLAPNVSRLRVTNDEIIPTFILQYFNTRKMKDEEIAKYVSSSSQPALTMENVRKFEFHIPSFEEQTKIANFLSAVDEKLNLLKEKKALLEDYKKGIMQKIFNQEIRFKDDIGKDFEDWEEKSLGELCDYKNGGSFEKFVCEDGVYNLISLNSIDITGKIKNSHKKVSVTDNSLQKGDLIMVLSDVAHGNFLGLTDIVPDDNYVLNQRMGALKPVLDFNSFYLKTFINFNQSYFKLMGQGSSQQNLSKGDIESFIIMLPSKEEQYKIANFVSAIDEKIELVSNQIQDTQEYKKGLLQQMFV